ncbi:hypothetical protein [Faecalibacillus faecis]|uniref:hypothetical protein n=1 Tax=Faecalibacillus faecis TaxID=1982628 RepID=UPI0022E84550|nr:hypothetical protein [Faecalibacillus faecis]
MKILKKLKEKLLKVISDKTIEKNDIVLFIGLGFIVYASYCLNSIFGNYVTGIVFILFSFFIDYS